jgi:hypothetical protein
MGEKRLLKTRVQKKTLFPKWNESTTFEICDENQMIEIVSHDSSLVYFFMKITIKKNESFFFLQNMFVTMGLKSNS